MSHSNISIFIPHLGCPNTCSFCNQNSITGLSKAPTGDEVNAICRKAFDEISDKDNTEIAFFGGSFTAINKNYMLELLVSVQEFIGENKFKGIRISTRPDCINDEILTLLKEYNVTSIELGVQSMSDEVLFANDRGHTSQHVKNAVALIKKYDFELGLQMMVGLYKSTVELDKFTANSLISMKPKAVRIYPVVILDNTKLGELFQKKEYIPYTLEIAITLCSELIQLFNSKNINIIKLGLHASEIVEKDLLGGLYHPAFRELCENNLYLKEILQQLENVKSKSITIEVFTKCLSKAIGQNKNNIIQLEKLGYKIKIVPSEILKNYEINIIEEENACI